MPGGIEKMVGIISALAQIQNQRRELDLREQASKEQSAQFARSMGLQEKSETFKEVQDALKIYAESDIKTRPALNKIFQAAFPHNPEMYEPFMNFASNAPMTVNAIRNAQATAGGQPGATPVQQEAFTNAATGMNVGQMGGSQVTGQIANQAQGAVTPFMGQEFAQRAAGGNSVLEAGLGQQFALDPTLMKNLAEVQGGRRMTKQGEEQIRVAGEGNEVGLAGVRQRASEAEMNIALQLAAKKQTGGLTPDDINRAQSILTDKLKLIGDPKVGSGVRQQAMSEYNSLVTRMGMSELMWSEKNPPTPASVVQRLWSQVSPVQPVFPAGQPGATQPVGTRPNGPNSPLAISTPSAGQVQTGITIAQRERDIKDTRAQIQSLQTQIDSLSALPNTTPGFDTIQGQIAKYRKDQQELQAKMAGWGIR